MSVFTPDSPPSTFVEEDTEVDPVLHRTGALDFRLPPFLEAHEPPEARGLARDEVRLMVATGADLGIRHAQARQLAEFLRPGDLVVVNTSATVPAAVDGRRGNRPVVVHLSTPLPGGLWIVELRQPVTAGNEPLRDAAPGELVELPDGRVHLLTPWPAADQTTLAATGTRLWAARLDLARPVSDYLARHGRPIRYSHAFGEWPLEAYQTSYATVPGSAEMPSAGRPLTPRVLTSLVARGVAVVPLVLHAGVSSLEEGETPPPERYEVPPATAALVNTTHELGGRVIAAGTTVVRALETVADARHRAHPGHGWTERVLSPAEPAQLVDGLLTGWHEPRSSHLGLLEAVASRPLLERSYEAALAEGYLWHEFGDVHLLLP